MLVLANYFFLLLTSAVIVIAKLKKIVKPNAIIIMVVKLNPIPIV